MTKKPATAHRTKPIVVWPGGKSSLLAHLLPLIPADAKCYCEVFGGGAALLLAKPRHPGQVEVYNDSFGELVNAFRMAKHHHPELIRELEFTPNSRAEMARQKSAPALTEIQRAAAFLHTRMISFGGDGGSFGVDKSSGSGACNSTVYLAEKIRAFAARFDRVAVECLDWQRCLDLYDTPATFFFIDPPYIGGAQKAYASWTLADFAGLRDRLSALKGRWLLTCNDSPELRELFAGCTVRPVSRSKGIAICDGPRGTYQELIITP